jgi:hypothetical protein
MESTHLCKPARMKYFEKTKASIRKGPTQEAVTLIEAVS